MSEKIIALGEIMLRLSPQGYYRFSQATSFDAIYGGGEANVLVSLSMFGHKTEYLTKVPDNDIGECATNFLRQYGVGTNFVKKGKGRLGIYFLEHGAAMRPSKVIYDREGSSISKAEESDFNFDEIFKDAKWFHVSGITPALSKSCAKITELALKKAKEKNITTSFDLNYRKKLWTPQEAQETMKPMMKYVDICIGNEEDAQNCLGFKLENTDIIHGQLDVQEYKKMLSDMKKEFGFKIVASSLRKSISADDNDWRGCLLDEKGEFHLSKIYPIHIVDRVGGGDAFASGVIHGFVKNLSPQDTLEFAVASSALKHTVIGDASLIKIEEIETLLKGDSSGRVQR